MNFLELQDEVIAMRFKEGQRASIKRWINLRYQFVWEQADWPWKRMGPSPLSVAAGSANLMLPPDFDRPLALFDEDGNELLWYSPDEFDELYLYASLRGDRGRPEAFKWVNDVITIAPASISAETFQLVYERGASYLQGGTTPVTGELTLPTDEPMWSSAFHYLLVPGAISTGLRLENDPTYGPMEEEFAIHLQAMKDHYLPTLSPAGNLQYGRDELAGL